MIKIPDFPFVFLMVWTVEVSVLILVAELVVYSLRRKSGNIQAAVWSTALVLCWVLPAAPFVIPSPLPWIGSPSPVTRIQIGTPHDRMLRPVSSAVPANGFSSKPPAAVSAGPLPEDPAEIAGGIPSGQPLSPASSVSAAQVAKCAVVVLWLSGMLFSLFGWLRCRKQVTNLLRMSQPVREASVIEAVERTRQILFLEGPIEIRTADTATAPFVKNFWRPLLFLPSYMLTAWPARERLAVIAHELGHLQRYDYPFHVGMQALRIAFWFWPPVWRMQRELHRTQDCACDECAAVVLGSGLEFGRALTRLAEHCLIQEHSFPALGILHSRHALIQRMENIMNSPIQRLSRISLRYRLVLFFTALFLFSLGGSYSGTVFSQTLDIQFLSTYPGYAFENTVAAPPYFAVSTREKNRRLVTYYEWTNDQWAMRKQVPQELTGDNKPEKMLANENLTVVVSSTLEEMDFFVIDHRSLESIQTHHFTLPKDTFFHRYKLYGSSLYLVRNRDPEMDFGKGSPDWFVSQYTFENGQFSAKEYAVAETLVIRDLAVFDDYWLIVDEQKGYHFKTEGDELVPLSSEPFVSTGPRYYSGRQLLLEARNHNSTPVLARTAEMSALEDMEKSDPYSDSEILFLIWDDPFQPTIDQIIQAPAAEDPDHFYTLLPWISFVEPHTLILSGRLQKKYYEGDYLHVEEEKMMLFFYEEVDGVYTLKSKIENKQGLFETAGSLLHNPLTKEFFRLDENYTLTPVPVPYERSPITGGIEVVNHTIFAVKPDKDTRTLEAYDAHLPSDINLVDSVPLPEILRMGELHDGLLELKVGRNRMFYSITPDNRIGQSLRLPSNPEGYTVSSNPSAVVWNDSFFALLYFKKIGDKGTDSGTSLIEVYRRNVDQLEERLCSFSYDAIRGMGSYGTIFLHEDLLGLYQERLSNEDAHLVLFSLSKPEQPELLADYAVPAEAPYSPLRYYQISINESHLIYATRDKGTHIYDLTNPRNPVLTHSFTESMQDINWLGEVLLLSDQTGIRFYHFTESHTPVLIGEMAFNGLSDVEISDNRMYLMRTTGLNIYQILTNTSTDLIEWRMY